MPGRLPMWTPWNFAGAPFVWPKFSTVPGYAKLHGVTARAALESVAGRDSRRAGGIYFLPAGAGGQLLAGGVAAWCYPLTGFFVLWQGYATCLPVVWLPWILLAVDKTAREAPAAWRRSG